MKPRTLACLTLLALLGGLGCPGQKSRTEAEGPAGMKASPRASAPSALKPDASVASPEGPYVLTRDTLDAYVRYQRAVLVIQDSLLTALSKLPATALKPDAGRASSQSAKAALRVLEAKARAEEQARLEAGLSERDAQEIERMVMAIINKRNLGRSFDPTTAINQWEAMRGKLPPAQRTELDHSVDDLKAQQAETSRLSEERRQFGDANVDLLLSREEELTRQYNAYLEKLTGRR